jgi:hypothetical protein
VVTLMFLFAPAVALISILIMNAFQKRQKPMRSLHTERTRVPRRAGPHHEGQRRPPGAHTEAAQKTTAKKPRRLDDVRENHEGRLGRGRALV